MAAALPESTFHVAVGRLFQGWTALQLAVQQSFGGPDSQEKAAWMVDAIEQWFKDNANLQPDEVEDFLAEILDAEFNTVADDGSLTQISASVCKYYNLIKDDRLGELEQLVAKLPAADVKSCQPQQQEGDDDDDDDSDGEEQMDTEPAPGTSGLSSPSQNVQNAETEKTEDEEDDGWTVVRKKPNKQR